MTGTRYLALDYGSSSGRGFVGNFNGERLSLVECHRFRNYFVHTNGVDHWDVFRLYHEVLQALEKARASGPVRSLGVDTWGTDYGLLDPQGQLLGNCRCMRNSRSEGLHAVLKSFSGQELYRRTGLQLLPGNTLFQLVERRQAEDTALANADKMLLLPSLLAYYLTGEMLEEYTIASTSMLCTPGKIRWEMSLLETFGVPPSLLAPMVKAGTQALPVSGHPGLQYVPVATHDTASAIAAAPLRPGEAFCSSGTWSMFGVELDAPILTADAAKANYSNEGGADGRVRFLKNMMGMWAVQCCQDQWSAGGSAPTWEEIALAAGQATPFRSLVDLEKPQFYRPGDMLGRLRDYCRETDQLPPESMGEVARCLYESMALHYRLALEQLEAILCHPVEALRIVGGGAQNYLLNQFSANALQRPVYAGPVESACAGNVLMQAMAHGELSSLGEARQVVRRSFPVEEYTPRDKESWEDAFGRYCIICKKKGHQP